MFKKIKKLFFVEEETEEVVLETTDEKKVEVNETTFAQTITMTSLEPEEQKVDKPITTFTLKDEVKPVFESRSKSSQPAYEFETILSPISGKTTKKSEPKFNKVVEKSKKETQTYSNVISPMFGNQKKESAKAVQLAEVGEEMTLEDFINNSDDKDIELVQFKLFDEEKK